MKSKITRLKEKLAIAVERRKPWEGRWQECYDYAMPNRTGFNGEQVGADRSEKIFDSTAVTSVYEFASRMQSGLTPSFSRWFEFRAPSTTPENLKSDVQKELDAISEALWEAITVSNLDQVLHESYQDLALGTGAILAEAGTAAQPLQFTSIPQPQFSLIPGPFGGFGSVFRHREMTLQDIEATWPKAVIDEKMKKIAEKKPEHLFSVTEMVERDWGHRKEEKYDFYAFCADPETLMVEASFVGNGSNPLIPFRWSKSSGETYGRGPLYNILSDVKTLNLVVELVLENAEMAVTGMWQADDDGVLNPDTISLLPGVVVPKAIGSGGLQPLEVPGRFDVSQMIIENMQHTIRKGLFAETLGPPEGTPMSAAEVHERMADLARVAGSAYGRMHAELVRPLIRRCVYILQKMGQLPDIPTIGGKEIDIVNVSPLAQAQHNDDVARVVRLGQVSNGLFGPQMTNLVINPEEAVSYMATKMGVPEKVIRNKVEREQLVQALQETQRDTTQQDAQNL